MFRQNGLLRVNGHLHQYGQPTLTLARNCWDAEQYVICESFFFGIQIDHRGKYEQKVKTDTARFLNRAATELAFMDPRITLEDVRDFLRNRIVSGSERHGHVDESFPEDRLLPALIEGLETGLFLAVTYEWPTVGRTSQTETEQATRTASRNAKASLDADPFEYEARAPAGEADEIAGMPYNGAPGSWASSMPGKMPQLRQYGLDGRPLTDFDLEAHHGNPDPHVHNWVGGVRDEGAPVSLLPW